MNFLNERAKILQQGAIRAMFDRASAMKGVISLGIGEPDMITPKLICEAGAVAMEKGFTHYTANAGTLELRRAVTAKSYLKDMGYNPDSEIIITSGGMGALSLVFLVTLNEGDEVLIQDPQWINHEAQVQYFGGKAVSVPAFFADNFEMDPNTIESLITPKTRVILINSPNNPTGAIIRGETLKRIAGIAQQYNLLVISDEVYSTLIYNEESFSSIASLPGMKERTIVINSFSKAYAMTGWRIGYAAGPESIIDRMVKCQENVCSCANAPGQYAAVTALDHGELCTRLRDIFAGRREFLLRGLAEIEGIRFNPPAGAFYVFPEIRSFGLSSREFCDKLLDEAGVVCIPGSAFGNCGEGHIRISYTCNEAVLKEALDRIRRFCKKLRAETSS